MVHSCIGESRLRTSQKVNSESHTFWEREWLLCPQISGSLMTWIWERGSRRCHYEASTIAHSPIQQAANMAWTMVHKGLPQTRQRADLTTSSFLRYTTTPCRCCYCWVAVQTARRRRLRWGQVRKCYQYHWRMKPTRLTWQYRQSTKLKILEILFKDN